MIPYHDYFSNASAEERKLPLYIATIGHSFSEADIQRPAGIPDYQILYCAGGSGTVNLKRNTFTLSEGKALILPPFTPHDYRPTSLNEDWHTLWVTYNGKVATECFDFDAEIRDLSRINFEKSFSCLLKTKASSADRFRRHTSSALFELLLSCSECPILTDGHTATENESGIREVIGYISENYSKTIELCKLSEISGLSEGHLCRVFKEYTHMRPIEYVTHIRIETAKLYLLSRPNESVSAIARKVGIDDPAYFSKIFKERCGITPSEFRKQNLI